MRLSSGTMCMMQSSDYCTGLLGGLKDGFHEEGPQQEEKEGTRCWASWAMISLGLGCNKWGLKYMCSMGLNTEDNTKTDVNHHLR